MQLFFSENNHSFYVRYMMIATMKINSLAIISTLVLIMSIDADPILIKVVDSQGQSLAPSIVYKTFQPRVAQENFFNSL